MHIVSKFYQDIKYLVTADSVFVYLKTFKMATHLLSRLNSFFSVSTQLLKNQVRYFKFWWIFNQIFMMLFKCPIIQFDLTRTRTDKMTP